MEKIILKGDYNTIVRKFNVRGRRMEFEIKQIPINEDPVRWIKDAIECVVIKATEGLLPTDKVGLSLCGDSFAQGPAWISFRDAADLTMDNVWDAIGKVFQSNSNGLHTDTFCIAVTSVRLPQGTARKRKYNSMAEEIKKRRGIIQITNKDNLCLPRAIVVAIAKITKDREYDKIRKNRAKLQDLKTQQLLVDSGIQIAEDGAGVEHLSQFQQHLTNFNIKVYNYGTKGRELIFDGKNDSAPHTIHLLYAANHYNVIISLTAAFACTYYCDSCNVPYEHKSQHRCNKYCSSCQQTTQCKKIANMKCSECNRSFKSQNCFDNHKRFNLCQQIKQCSECLQTFKADRQHNCGEVFCKICNKHQKAEHLCHIQCDNRKPSDTGVLFVFYDLETIQERVIEGTTNKLHEPNLCVFRQCCKDCINLDVKVCYTSCGVKEQVLKINTMENFTQYLLNQRKLFKKIICIAHNGQAFDHQFVLNYILTKTTLTPELIMRGTKIICMKLDNVKFIDSFNYFPMPLSGLPKAFDLSPELKKGYFPHLFNKTENKNYIGPLPPIEFYSPEKMKGSDDDSTNDPRKEFLKWYTDHKNDTFDMQKEIVEYCQSDVKILAEACLKFRKTFIEECSVCPFTEAVTIASACNLVYRRNFLKPDTIGIIPKNGYRYKDTQSKIAIQWLIWEEKKRNIRIINSANQHEKVICGVKVDGYCEETKEIFEFHGCFYHGHTCLSNNRDNPITLDPLDTLNFRYDKTLAKTLRLRDNGWTVIEKWECEFRNELSRNLEMDYLHDHPLILASPLNPRDAFFGGRTGNTRLYYECKPAEKIKYIDICSLYPWVCKNGKFPIGHPKLFVGNEECQKLNLNTINGLIKCTVLPPTDLYHPVLCEKLNNKLLFSLCHTCGSTLNQNDCEHSDEERAISGTWVIDEVVKALEKGYKIMLIHEIWCYNVVQHNETTEGLFTSMMNKFIKMKQEASGWPSECSTDTGKLSYIKQFEQIEKVKLDFNKIEKNSGLRSLAKLMLNSFWGKFGQRENLSQTTIFNEPHKFYELMTSSTKTVNNLFEVNDETIIANWEYIDEAVEPLPTVNVCIAAYTTAQARLKLYSYLEKLNDRVLYYDTDSVVYISREDELDPPTGNYIGDMTDELSEYGVGSYITEFVSGGPKNYAYKVWSSKTSKETMVCKVKGIGLNYEVSKLINFESIKNMVLTADNIPIMIKSMNFRRTKVHEVITTNEIKKYQIKSEKRKFLPDYDSVPYGFKKQRLE